MGNYELLNDSFNDTLYYFHVKNIHDFPKPLKVYE